MGDVRTLPIKNNDTAEQFLVSMRQQLHVLQEEGLSVQAIVILTYTDKDGDTNYRGGWSEDTRREYVHYAAGWLQQRAQEAGK